MDACLDACVITPNHVRGILLVEAGFKPASTAIVRHGLPEIAQICAGIGISWSRRPQIRRHPPDAERSCSPFLAFADQAASPAVDSL